MKFLAVNSSISRTRLIKITFLAWFGILGFDFFLHGGLLASFYTGDRLFLLPPLEAFRRIPFGYVGFFIMTTFLVWLLAKLEERGWRQGLIFGAVVGGVLWVSLALGMYSISTATPKILIGWTVGQTDEMAYAIVK
jgi:hypothetical protein